jgi:hypothetical protein
MGVSDLISQVTKGNNDVVSKNGESINSLWDSISQTVLSDLADAAAKVQGDNSIVSTLYVNYDKSSSIYTDLDQICLLKAATPSAYALDVDIYRDIHVGSYKADTDVNDSHEYITVSLAISTTNKGS